MNNFNINLYKLSEERKGEYQFKIKDDFLEEEEEFNNIDITCNVLLIEENSNNFKLNIDINGEVYLTCDLTNEKFRKKICNKIKFIVKFGEVFDDEDLDIIIIPRGSNSINIRKYIYESILFSIPLKKEHPMLEDENIREKYYRKIEDINNKNSIKPNLEGGESSLFRELNKIKK